MKFSIVIAGVIILWIAIGLIWVACSAIKRIWNLIHKGKKIPNRQFRASNFKALAKGR